MSSVINKVKNAVSGHSHSEPEGTHGHHNNRVANAADPRVDSDRDGSKTIGGSGTTGSHGLTGTHGTTGTSGLTGSHNTSGLTGSHGTTGTSGLTGSHGTSGLTGSHGTHGTTGTSGLTGSHGTSGLTGSHGTHGTTGTSGLTGSHNTGGLTGSHGTHAEGTHGPHSSRLANAADPRIDSDRDGSKTMGGSGTTGAHGLTGAHNTTGTSTAHSAMGHVGAAVGGTHGTGPAPDTAGPHKSNMMNKVDPRVDSDLDGSKTVGGDKTYSQGTRDPTDAAQVPPSVLRKHIGDVQIHHDDHTHERERRHSLATHQEKMSGV